jgi:hypothetical protein
VLTALVTIGVSGITPPFHGALGQMMRWLEEVADQAPLALIWLAAAAIGFLVYFVPVARLLDSLAD